MTNETLQNEILLSMTEFLDKNQLIILRDVLAEKLKDVKVESTELTVYHDSNDHYLKLYIANKRIEGLSEKTLIQYYNSVRRFYTEMNADVLRCNSDYIRVYMCRLAEQGNSKTSVNNARNYLSSFFKWLYEEGYIKENIVSRIKKVKLEKRQPNLLNAYDVENIRRACENDRETALIDLLYSAGLRCNEVVNFKVSDINFAKKTFIVHGKGSKDREIPMTTKLQVSLDKYLTHRGYESDYIFGRINGDHGQVSDTTIEKTVKRISERAGVKGVVVHKFRHYFCSELCRKGMNIQEVQKLMGHVSIETTAKVYNHILDDDLVANFRKFSA